MVIKSIIGAICTCLGIVSLSANAALVERLGGLAYYDDVADLTWLADANATGTQMTWFAANSWVENLDVAGVTGWRLANTNPIDGTTADDSTLSYIGTEDLGYNVSAPGTLYAGSMASEMAYLFHNTLGNLGYCDPALSTTSYCANQIGYGMSNTGPFNNVQSAFYWSAMEFMPESGKAWYFDMKYGLQHVYNKGVTGYAWAVHSGDVGAVPVPAAVWLFGSGLLGLIGVARKKQA